MRLADDEKAMLDGAEGPAVAAAMDLLVRYGEALGAERLCDIRNVAGTMTQPSPVKAKLVREGGWNKAFSCSTSTATTTSRSRTCACPPASCSRVRRGRAGASAPYPPGGRAPGGRRGVLRAAGVNILATCTPYQVGNLPVRGEHCAWMESSAVVYCNSVLGARTNAKARPRRGAASLTGKIPCWGNHLPENRYGTHLIEATVPGRRIPRLGHVRLLRRRGGAGEPAGRHRRPPPPDLTDLKHFGAATASSGGVEIYHIPGITPEAATLEAASAGGPAREDRVRRAGAARGSTRAQRPGRVRRRRLHPARLPARLARPDRQGGPRCWTARAQPGHRAVDA